MRSVLLALGLLLGAGAPAQSAEFTVGVEDLDYYPHYRADPDGGFSGYARAVLDAFAADVGHRFSYRPLPVNRLYAEFVAGKVDFKYPDNAFWGKLAKAGAEVRYSAPVTSYVDGLLVLPEAATATDIGTIGSVAGFTPFPYQAAIDAQSMKLETRLNLEQLLRGVLVGRLPAAYVNIDVARHALRAMGEEGRLVFNEAMPADRGHYHLSSIAHPQVIEAFDAWLASHADTLAALRQEYGLQP
jgi:hypothetical protein